MSHRPASVRNAPSYDSRRSAAARQPARLLLACVLTAACQRAPEVEAPEPAVTEDLAEEVVPVPRSIVESEIRYELDSALLAIEKAVPRRFGDIEQRHQLGGNRRAKFAFAARRTPFVIAVDGQRITISSTVEYEGRGWYDPPIGPTVSAGCGTGEVPKPRARVRIESTLRLTENWSLAPTSKVTRAAPYSDDPRDRCRLTVFQIDVTEKVMDATQGELQKRLRTLDRALAGINTRAHFEKWWRAISRPIRLTDSIYFTINPSDVQLGRIDVDSGFAVAHIRLEASPRIQTGHRPNDFDLFTPLPPLRSRALVGKGLRVALEGSFGYDVGNTLLAKALVGKTIQQGKYKLNIREAKLSGIGGGRVALGVRVDGSVRGRFFLTGTPAFDNETGELFVPDLDYDLQTSDLLVRGIEWLGGGWVRDELRQRARFSVEGELGRLRELAEKGMNRDLAEGVELVATVEPARNVSVRATRQAILVRAGAEGSARLDINKPLRLKRMAGAPAARSKS